MAQNTMFMKNVEEPTKPQQPAVEQKQPTYPQFNSAADIDARFMQMMERDAERDRAEQQRRLQRQQFAQSMGDLGNVLIDTIKMSGGALVTPRDVTARYQQMDAQSQRIYDTYRARMDLLRKYQLEKAAAEKARQQGLADKAAERAWSEQMAKQKQEFDAEQARLGREASAAENAARIAGNLQAKKMDVSAEYARIKAYEEARDSMGYLLDFGDGNPIPMSKVVGQSHYPRIYDKLREWDVIPEDVIPVDDEGKPKKLTDVDIRNYVNTYIQKATPEQKREIYKMVTGLDKEFEATQYDMLKIGQQLAQKPDSSAIYNQVQAQSAPWMIKQ